MEKTFSVSVTYNPDLCLLNRQIDSLSNQIYKIIIVDNCSSNIEEIERLVKEINHDILLIKLTDNMGLGYAQNIGIDIAKSAFATHVLLLDQDSILEPSFIKKMEDSIDTLKLMGEKVGAIGPVYFNENTGEVYPITKYYGPFIKRLKPVDELVEATFLIASGCVIPMDAINIVGGMDENLFIDYVDVEWCFRAKNKGFKVFADPNVKMSHTVGDDRTSILGRSISIHSPLRRYYLYRNSIHMIKNQTIDKGYKLREFSFNLIRFIVFLTISNERVKYCKYSLKGWVDGIKGITGKCPYNF